MTLIKRLTLPNGHTLPLALVLERGFVRETRTAPIPVRESQNLLTGAARRLALRDSIAGELLDERLRFTRGAACDTLDSSAECREMIAARRQSILMEGETTNDGTGSQR